MHALRDLWHELWAEKSRMAMVTLGLLWGTLALSVLMAFGEGTYVAMHEVLRQSGDTMLRLGGGATTVSFAGLPAGRPVRLSPADAAALAQVPGVAAVCSEFAASARLRAGTRAINCNLSAVDASYAAIRGIPVRSDGRFLSEPDLQQRRRVVVLGERIAGALFGGRPPVGETVFLWDAPFVVVGVVPQRATVMSYNGNDEFRAMIPTSTAIALRGWRQASYVLLQAAVPAHNRELIAAVRRVLGERLRLAPDDLGALRVNDHIGQAQEIGGIVLGTRVFLFVVGALGLLVAAVAVGNVMYVMVEERVREIGLRLALGATPRQVQATHLVEALLVVATGGGLGLLCSAGLLFAIDQIPFDATAKAYLGRPLLSVATATGVAGLLGVAAGVAGWFPARRAAAVEPVEALRHE